MNTKVIPLALVFATLVIFPTVSLAYQFVPTDAEWLGWPDYCKAKYAWTNIGRRSKFASTVTAAQKRELSSWEKAGIRGIHHHCAGTAWLRRAQLERNETRRKYLLRQARAETQFSYDRSKRSSPQFVYLAVQMATIIHENGESAIAVRLLQDVIVEQPDNGILYSATAIMQRRLGNLKEAKQTLLRGNKAMAGMSPEINYNLGLLCLELGQIDEAEEYAKFAYEQGYPLPGLRRKLRLAGRM
jgi:Flp pilus assembly protein TadD